MHKSGQRFGIDRCSIARQAQVSQGAYRHLLGKFGLAWISYGRAGLHRQKALPRSWQFRVIACVLLEHHHCRGCVQRVQVRRLNIRMIRIFSDVMSRIREFGFHHFARLRAAEGRSDQPFCSP